MIISLVILQPYIQSVGILQSSRTINRAVHTVITELLSCYLKLRFVRKNSKSAVANPDLRIKIRNWKSEEETLKKNLLEL